MPHPPLPRAARARDHRRPLQPRPRRASGRHRAALLLLAALASCTNGDGAPPAGEPIGARATPDAPAPGGDTARPPSVPTHTLDTAMGLSMDVPAHWLVGQPSSSMRQAELVVPGGDGPAGDAELVVYYFGAGGGGSVADNLERWRGQFEQTDADRAHDRSATVRAPAGPAHVLDVRGRFVAPVRPGAPETHDQAGWRMLAAVVETAKGNVFVKLVGPAATVERAAGGFDAMLASMRLGVGS